jgi:Protein of unknown function (DUF3352)
MRRLISALLLVLTLALAGCGGEDSESALDTALSFLPSDAPLALAIDTDIDGDQYDALRTLLDKFPFGDQAADSLREQLEQTSGGINFNDDVRPLLGNPVVVGIPTAESVTGDSDQVVVAMQGEDGDAVNDLVEKLDARETGEESGATLYERDGTPFAVKDETLVLAGDREQLTQALERAEGDDHLDEDTFNEGLDGLPEDALARIYADIESLLQNDPDTEDARRIEWVAALRTLGASVLARDDSLEVEFRLRTEGDLSEEDLPIAPGDEAPAVIEREGEVGLGIRDLAHIVQFAEAAGQAIDPGGFGDYEQAKRTIDSQLGVSIDEDLIGQLRGDVSASVSVDGRFGVRAQLEDPQEFERTLERVADVLPSFAEGAGFGTVALSKPGPGEDFYALAQPDGDAVVFGVANEVLVVANDPRRAGELASQEPSDVEDARGSVVTSADAGELVRAVLEQIGPAFGLPDIGGFEGAIITRPLGDLTGSMSASTEELRGRFRLAIE